MDIHNKTNNMQQLYGENLTPYKIITIEGKDMVTEIDSGSCVNLMCTYKGIRSFCK